jgi:roadblock/LC7 domain-containing protein
MKGCLFRSIIVLGMMYGAGSYLSQYWGKAGEFMDQAKLKIEVIGKTIRYSK